MSKVLVVQPWAYSKFPGMPNGLVVAASALQKAGHEVHAIHLHATPKTDMELESIIAEKGYEYVCIGGTSPSQPEAYTLARLAKKVNPAIITIKGGPHETFYAAKTAEHPEIDFVLQGAGENLPVFLERIKSGNLTSKMLRGGIYDSSKAKLPVADDPHVSIADIANAPLPNRMMLYTQNPEYYNFLGVKTAQTRSFRGCVFHCNYCAQSSLKDTYINYSWDYLTRDLDRLKSQGFKAIYWDDALFTLKRDRVFKLLDIVKPYGFSPMGCITRAGINTDQEMFERMYDAGFRLIWMSLESGDPNIRQSVLGRGKLTTPDDVKNAVQIAKEIGFMTFVNIIVGSPGETDKTIQNTVDALKYVRPDGVSASVYTMYPGVEGCDKNTYEKPINRDSRLKIFDEGYGGHIAVEPGLAVGWYHLISQEIVKSGINMLKIEDCSNPKRFVKG